MSPDGFVSHVPCRPIELSAHANEKKVFLRRPFRVEEGARTYDYLPLYINVL